MNIGKRIGEERKSILGRREQRKSIV